ncbi:MAG: helix-turn-helix transcriptional regulator [Myxococcales bacterium]|nr:helix-turn-helix transcriptional regulator [Myxococcales bacterium]
MSKTRQAGSFSDGDVWVRTHPVTYLHDRTDEEQSHHWHQLTYAASGHLELEVLGRDALARALIPPDCAVWVPAGVPHRETMRAPVSVRTLYLAPGVTPSGAASHVRTLAVAPLLRELIVHVTREGALDGRRPAHAALTQVLVDLVGAAQPAPLSLRTPSEPRARRLAQLVADRCGEDVSLAELARQAGASLRTMERLFVHETALTLGAWRRTYRLLRARRLLAAGASVSDTAFDVGYATVSAFSAAYRRHFGHPPSASR